MYISCVSVLPWINKNKSASSQGEESGKEMPKGKNKKYALCIFAKDVPQPTHKNKEKKKTFELFYLSYGISPL